MTVDPDFGSDSLTDLERARTVAVELEQQDAELRRRIGELLASDDGLAVVENTTEGERFIAELRRALTGDAGCDGTSLCPRCGSGWPICTDGFGHDETCAKYVWADDVCAPCGEQMATEEAQQEARPHLAAKRRATRRATLARIRGLST